MSYLSKKQLITAFNNGHLEDVVKQLVRYGKIITDHSWSDDSSSHYAGEYRCMEINHHSLTWKFTKRNGEVIEVEYQPD